MTCCTTCDFCFPFFCVYSGFGGDEVFRDVLDADAGQTAAWWPWLHWKHGPGVHLGVLVRAGAGMAGDLRPSRPLSCSSLGSLWFPHVFCIPVSPAPHLSSTGIDHGFALVFLGARMSGIILCLADLGSSRLRAVPASVSASLPVSEIHKYTQSPACFLV